jgi:Flp pilus assembly pilin Flp
MLKNPEGLTLVEYIILAALILVAVGTSAWQLAGAIGGRLDAYRNQL